MVKQADFLLELVRVVFESILLDNIFALDSLNVVKALFRVGQHLGRIVEVDSNHVVTQSVSNPVFRRVVDPLFHSHIRMLAALEDRGTTRSLLVVTFCAVFKHTLASSSVYVF